MKKQLAAILLASSLTACKMQPQTANELVRNPLVPTYEINGEKISPTGRTLGFTPDSVAFSPRAMNSIAFLYNTITARANLEYALCLHGSTDKNKRLVRINEVRLPFMMSAYHDSTSFNCDDSEKDFLGALHSHPVEADKCGFGTTDMKSFYRSKNSVIGIVACKNGMVSYVK